MYEMSSDSEDDCYNKFPEKLQKLKTKHALSNPVKYIDLVTDGALDVCPVTKQNSDVTVVVDELNDIIDVEARSLTRNASDTPLEEVTRRGRGRRRGSQHALRQSIMYSVGNTHDYADASDHQVLFSNINKKPAPEVQGQNTSTDLDESFDNEELSVKVYWQHSEVFKFNIRRLQKMTQIFDFFVEKEGVSRDRLFLTYNFNDGSTKILQPDDTPDSINYNIAKFIDGGIVSKKFQLSSEVESPKKKGFFIKFQCQSKKKPLEYSLGREEKLQIAMVKCAEELEVPIAKLQFELDGETVPGTATPYHLEMESGDCIDVKIINLNKY